MGFPPANDAPHSVTDMSGAGLFASGPMEPGTKFQFSFEHAGSYAVLDETTSHSSRVRLPIKTSPKTGGLNTAFLVRWSKISAPAGFAFDVQIKRPGQTTSRTGKPKSRVRGVASAHRREVAPLHFAAVW